MRLIVLFTMLLAASSAVADGKTFYERSAEGWFWYHDPIFPEEPEEEDPLEPEPIIVPPPQQNQAAEPKGPPAFSVQWFDENFEQILNRAIDNPTQENVTAYWFAHRIMMDKANQFAVKSREVAMSNPYLDESTRKTPGATANRLTEKQQLKILTDLSERINEADGALWFWYSDDIYSKRMARVLRGFRNRTGTPIIAFSVDGGPLPDEAEAWFPDYIEDGGISAQRVGVTHTPALALALPPDRVQLVAHGVIGRSKVEDRLVIAADRLGLLQGDELEIYQGRNPGSFLVDMDNMPDFEGNATDQILEVMSEVFVY